MPRYFSSGDTSAQEPPPPILHNDLQKDDAHELMCKRNTDLFISR